MKAEFIVPDMTCGHCVKTITEAVRKVQPAALVSAQLETHHLTVEATADAAAIEAAIHAEGYSPQRLGQPLAS